MRRCVLDPTICNSSLFRDFLSVQREEDCAAAKEAVQQFVNMQATISHEQTQPVASVTSQGAQVVPDVRSVVCLNYRVRWRICYERQNSHTYIFAGIFVKYK